MSFPRYPKYKESGVEWLGEVPEHWTMTRISRAVSCIGSGTTPRSDAKEYYEDGEIPWINTGDLNDGELHSATKFVTKKALKDYSTLKLYPSNSLLFAMYGATIGRVAVLRLAATVNQACCVLSGESFVLSKFLFYWFIGMRVHLLGLATGGGQPNLSQDVVRSLRIAFPKTSDQQLIASFLDRETAKIDALIAEQQRLIELLQEKRQAVISHAVTKGLNPDAPMKDSGIEWLGEVPAHWEVGRVKDYFITCSGGTPNTAKQDLYYTEGGDGYPWVRTTDLNNDRVSSVPIYITEQAVSDSACSLLPPGTVMVAMYGGDGTVGKNGLLTFHATINQAVCGLLPSSFYSCDFIFRYMQFYRPYWMIGAESSRKDPNISQDRVRNAPVVRPPVEEQKLIAEFIEQQIDVFNRLQTAAESSISLLQERRSALISAAVTGQIDVRGLAPKEAA